jgi:hypothetical protein
MEITLEWLQEKNADQAFQDRFADVFGESGADYQAVLDYLAADDYAQWARWLMSAAGPTDKVMRITGDLITEKSIFYSGSILVTGEIKSKYLFAGEGIKAGMGIEAGTGIKAGWGIEAGRGIKAGDGIKAGEDWGIYAGVKLRLSLKKGYATIKASSAPANICCGQYVGRE